MLGSVNHVPVSGMNEDPETPLLRSVRNALAALEQLAAAERPLGVTELGRRIGLPPSSTHRQLDSAALARAGIPEGLVRVSVGLEDADDLIADFDNALAAAGRSLSNTLA